MLDVVSIGGQSGSSAREAGVRPAYFHYFWNE
jgi:hypothetical protein